MKKSIHSLFIIIVAVLAISGCSTPEEKAEKFYQKGMALIDSDPDKAKLEFQNALQIKKVMPKATYALGLIAEKKGDFKGTYSLMSEVLEREPNNVDALIKTGQIALAAGKIDLAQERSDKAFKIDQNNVNNLNLLAAIQLKLKNSAAAIDYANKALAIDPSNQDAYILLATERLLNKDNIQAIALLDKALAKNNKNFTVQMMRIKVLEEMNNQALVEQSYQNLIKLFSDKPLVRKSYAQFLLKNNRQDEAEQQIRAIANVVPDASAKLDIVRFVISTKGPEAGRAELENFVKKEPENYDLAFALVKLYQVQKQPQLEDQLLNQIQQNAGNSANGYKAQGMIAQKLIQAGKIDAANKILKTIIDADKSNSQALTLRAGLALKAKNYDAAVIDLRTVTGDSPTAYNAFLMLAYAYESSGSPELAEEQYLKAFKNSKSSPSIGVPYAEFLLRRKQAERAEKVFEDILAANPDNLSVLRALAQARIARGDYTGAQLLADKAKILNKNDPLADQILGAISASQNDAEGALSAFKRAHDAAPNEMQPIIAIVNTYMRLGKNKEALDFINTVLSQNPNNTEANIIKGQILSVNGNAAEAQQIFSDIIASNAKNSVAYQQLAIAQQRANQIELADKTIKTGLKNIPMDLNLMLTQANLYEAANRVDDAIKTYEEIVKVRTDSEVVNNNLASLLLDARTDQASIERAYNLVKPAKESLIPQFLDTYGWASYKVGKLDDAEIALKKATEKMPNVAVFHYHLAKVYIAKSEQQLAKESLQKAVSLAESQPFTQKNDAIALLKSL